MSKQSSLKVAVGDRIIVRVDSFSVEGTVHSAAHYGEDGWYIEMIEASVPGGVSYWKQGIDGGQIISINGVAV